MRFRILLAILFLSFFSSEIFAQNFNKEVLPEIKKEFSHETRTYNLTLIAKNQTDRIFGLRYEWKFLLQDKSAKENSRILDGRFTLESYEVKKIEEFRLGLPPAEMVLLVLFYDENDQLISTLREIIKPNLASEAPGNFSYQKQNEGIKLVGFVTEDTKTKAGKDFYDLFYQKYNLLPEKSDQIITISEMINFGRTTRILIKVGDQIIYQFFAQPKIDYLREQVDISIKQLVKYLEYLKTRNQMKQY